MPASDGIVISPEGSSGRRHLGHGCAGGRVGGCGAVMWTAYTGAGMSAPGLRALTIRQPWASAILYGTKWVENRSWPTKYRGPLIVHAAAKLAPPPPAGDPEMDWIRNRLAFERGAWTTPAELARGAILGAVDVVDCVPMGRDKGTKGRRDEGDESAFGPTGTELSGWASGPWCWLLARPRVLVEPIPLTGRLGLFELPRAIGERLEKAEWLAPTGGDHPQK
jgi:activating signal cointegrator 1